jgi:YVTN family beta-propeller protein
VDSSKPAASALAITLLLSGCLLAKPPVSGPALDEEGSLLVYLLPLPADALRLSFRVQEMTALREDGTSVPVSLLVTDLSGESRGRERRLARADLPPGRYTGLSLQVGAGSLRGEEGNVPLLPPAKASTIPISFEIEKRRAVVVSLGLDYRNSIESSFRFTPAFSAEIPVRPAPGLIAMASSGGPDSVTLFDKVSGRVVGAVRTARRPSGVTLDPERKRAYVAATGDDTVESIGLLEEAVLAQLRLHGGDNPLELALTPDGTTLLCANSGSSTVSVIDALPLIETARIPVGNNPSSVVADRSGRRAYVFNTGSSTITVLDVAARSVAATIPTDAGPFRGQFNRVGDRLYVIHRSSPYLSVIDPLSLAVTARIYVGMGATALKVDPQTDRIYLARRNAGSVEVFDPLSSLPTDAIPMEGDVSFLAIDGEGDNLYALLGVRHEVQVVRIVGKQTIARAEVGENPYGLALAGER